MLNSIYFKIYLLELRKGLSYRSHFWVNYFGTTFISFIIFYYLWKNIFEHNQVKIIGGMTFDQMIVYSLLSPIIFRIIQGTQIGFISTDIYDGGLSKYIIYPINIYLYKFSSYLAQSTFYLIQFFLVLIIYEIYSKTHGISSNFEVINIILASVFLLFSSLAYYSLAAILELVSFWAENIWSLGVMLRMIAALLGGALIPLSLLSENFYEIVQLTPFPYLVYYPLKLVLGEIAIGEISKGLLVLSSWTLAFIFIYHRVWIRGQKVYTGVGM